MLKIYVGVVRFQDDRDFIIMVDGESEPVADAVKQVIQEVWGPAEIEVQTAGVDFIEFIHPENKERKGPDGYVLGCEVGSLKRIGFAVQNARRLRNMAPHEGKSPR